MEMTFRRKVFLGLLLSFGSAIFAEESPNATDTEKRIVILGDSITVGYGLSPKEAYPALLQKKITKAELPYTVANAGVSGDTTADPRLTAGARGADILISEAMNREMVRTLEANARALGRDRVAHGADAVVVLAGVVAAELEHACALLPLMRADACRRTAPILVQCDACNTGDAVVYTEHVPLHDLRREALRPRTRIRDSSDEWSVQQALVTFTWSRIRSTCTCNCHFLIFF